jgi:Protein of unknown function (DUF3995)
VAGRSQPPDGAVCASTWEPDHLVGRCQGYADGPHPLAPVRAWGYLGCVWGVALLLLAGAAFSVGMTRRRLRGRRRRAVVILGWLGGTVLLARGLLLEVVLLTGTGGVASAVGPSQTHWSPILWNPWFVVGGSVVLLATRQLQRV